MSIWQLIPLVEEFYFFGTTSFRSYRPRKSLGRSSSAYDGDRDELQPLIAESNWPTALVRSQRARAAALSSVARRQAQQATHSGESVGDASGRRSIIPSKPEKRDRNSQHGSTQR
ncbi:predicted protein [Uncinocarpus reesii 1704]|uniref:Uncharacterized protein n=1 Tax=Uncinocarpus reesii (strain UAMH 1704) TaxID=336963 RepID=C4JT09_UNCRE|nr:uncharacterized protein UREG_05598 [Uncinocarpus reesii 1704]EEP80756.1 predicted protein [Uncinocarpus reesii 1704]